MAKIGTAHVEIKPVLDDAALDRIVKRIEDAVAEGVRRGLAVAPSAINVYTTAEPAEVAEAVRSRTDFALRRP